MFKVEVGIEIGYITDLACVVYSDGEEMDGLKAEIYLAIFIYLSNHYKDNILL